VTTCHAFGPATMCFSSPEYQRPAAADDGPLLQTTIAETPCTVSFSVPKVLPTSVNLLEPLLAEKSESESTCMHRRQVRALPAFCVSGVRTTRRRRGASRHSPSAARRGRTARRSMGARLQPAPEVASVSSLAYDPSRTRTKIQQGLRAGRQPGKPAHRRECKTPVACNYMVDQSGELAHLSIIASMFSES